jgi:hypothetical protein
MADKVNLANADLQHPGDGGGGETLDGTKVEDLDLRLRRILTAILDFWSYS